MKEREKEEREEREREKERENKKKAHIGAAFTGNSGEQISGKK